MKRLCTVLAALVLLIGLVPVGSLPVAAASVDLAVTDFTWDTGTQIAPGTSVVFSVTVKNEGSATLTNPFAVTFGTAATTFCTVTYTDTIAPGASVTISSQSWRAVKGDYMVAVRVDAEGTISESNEKNNTAQANLRVAEDKLTSAYSVTQKLMEKYGLHSLIFSEDFNDLSSVDTTNSGKEGYKWYVARAYGAGVLTTDDYSVENGVMSVHTEKPTYNYGLDTYNCKTSVGFTYNKGYMEIRLRIPRGRKNTEDEKGIPAIWALPPEKLENRAKAWVEMDWMEYWGIGGYDTETPGGFYTICLHQQHLTGSVVTTHFKNSNYRGEGLGDGQWHTMGWLWQDGLFVAYLDGVEVMRQTYSASTEPIPSVYTMKSDGTVDKMGVYSMLNTQYNPIIIGGSKDNPLEIDYVRVWNDSRGATQDSDEPPVSDETTPTTLPQATTEDVTQATTGETEGETSTTETTGTADTTEPTDRKEQENKSSAIYVAVIGGCVLLLGCAAVLWLYQKKKQPEADK